MNVEDAMPPRCDEDRSEKPHVAGEANEIRLGFCDDAHDFFLVGSASRVVAVIDQMCGETELASASEARCIRLIRDDTNDLRVELTLDDRLMDCGKV
jgi:hypothetical protein